MKRIVADPKKCMACRQCELSCALAHAQAAGLVEVVREGVKPRIYIESASGLAVPLQCRHCEDAPCVRVCPTGCLHRVAATAPVLAEAARCIGCAFCVEACPFGVIRLARCSAADAPEGRLAVVKCDLCQARTVAGLAPACVACCPVHALSFEEVDEGAKRKVRAAALAAVGGNSHPAVPEEAAWLRMRGD